MLPMHILRAGTETQMMVELKNGETYNGLLDKCDTFMNLKLKDAICTAADGEKFWKMKEVFLRGNTIKYVQMREVALEKAEDEEFQKQIQMAQRGAARGVRGTRGGDRKPRGSEGGRRFHKK